MTEEFKKIDEALLEEDFDENGLYVDENGDTHIAKWKKINSDMMMRGLLNYLNNGGDINALKR